jgi:hypothetical protein
MGDSSICYKGRKSIIQLQGTDCNLALTERQYQYVRCPLCDLIYYPKAILRKKDTPSTNPRQNHVSKGLAHDNMFFFAFRD